MFRIGSLALLVTLSTTTVYAAEDCELVVTVLDEDANTILPQADVLISEHARGDRPVARGVTDATGAVSLTVPRTSSRYTVWVDYPGYWGRSYDAECSSERTHLQAPIALDTYVSLIELIANPVVWHKKEISVYGFLSLAFECNHLYLHKEDHKRHFAKNSVWVYLAPEVREQCRALNRRYVRVEGVFSGTHLGHGVGASGSISVTGCGPRQ